MEKIPELWLWYSNKLGLTISPIFYIEIKPISKKYKLLIIILNLCSFCLFDIYLHF